jgi:hypothetical protein
MCELELCNSCHIHFPTEYAEECARCQMTLCPICDEDGHPCHEQAAEPLPLAA